MTTGFPDFPGTSVVIFLCESEPIPDLYNYRILKKAEEVTNWKRRQ
jgi:hypothetical protein